MHFKFENYFNNQENRSCINENFVQPQIVADFSVFKSILKQLLYLDDVDLNVFGNYLYYAFFASDDSEGELDFDIVDITAMLAELKDFDISQDTINLLDEYCLGDISKIANECEKLKNLIEECNKILNNESYHK